LELLKTHTYKEVEAMTGIKKRTLINRKNVLASRAIIRDSSNGLFLNVEEIGGIFPLLYPNYLVIGLS
jgi:Cry35Ab1 HTH C-terminal domain